MCDWRKGNAYQFETIEKEGCREYLVSNVHYSIILQNPREAKEVVQLLNKVQIGNGDGFSKREFLSKISSMEKDYLKHDNITLSEKILVEQIFRGIKGMIK